MKEIWDFVIFTNSIISYQSLFIFFIVRRKMWSICKWRQKGICCCSRCYFLKKGKQYFQLFMKYFDIYPILEKHWNCINEYLNLTLCLLALFQRNSMRWQNYFLSLKKLKNYLPNAPDADPKQVSHNEKSAPNKSN